MTKRILYALLALTLLVSMVAFVACGEEEEEPVEAWEWPDRLISVTTSTRSPLYGAIVAWMTPLGEEVGTKFRLITEADSRLQEQWVREGRIFTKAPHQNRATMYGEEGFARRDWGPYHSRIWYSAGLSYWGAVTLGDSGIETVYDIKPGSKCNLVTTSEAPQQSVVAIAAWAGVDSEDIIWIPMSSSPLNARFLLDGKSDWTFTYHTTPSWYEVEASPHGLRWLGLPFEEDPEAAERFLKIYPWTAFGYATGGVPTSEGVPMAMNIVPYITRADTDPELIYRMVKWLDENYDVYKEGNPWCKAMTPELTLDMASNNYEPIHDGTVRYFEEIGVWTEELETKRQYNIELMDKWVMAYQDAINMADDRGITVEPEGEEWLEFWSNYKATQNLPLLVYFQEPGKEQPVYSSFYDYWHSIKPTY